MKRLFWIAMWMGSLGSLGALVGCGGLGDDRSIASLNETEVKDLCEEAMDRTYEPTHQETCQLGAIFISSTPEDCERTVVACVAREEEMRADEPTCESASAASIADGCTGTVGDYRACVDALASRTEGLYHASCSVVGTLDAPSLSTILSAPECEPVMSCFVSGDMMSDL